MELPHRNIRFATTEDGVSIAYWEIGEGKPVVIIQNFGISHAELEWGVPSMASFYVDMAERYRVIRFDPRGIGLSGDPPGGWGALTESGAQQAMTTERMGLDIAAVTSALQIESFALFALSVQAPVALAYAAGHPEVSELIISDGMAAIAAGWLGPMLRSQIGLEMIEQEAGGPVFNIWERIGPHEETALLQRVVRALDGRGLPGAHGHTQLEWDAESKLDAVSIPTLILSTRTTLVDTLPDARYLAAHIADARLVSIDGDERSAVPYWTDREKTLAAIDGFLKPAAHSTQLMSGFRTVVFTDMVGSTEYTRRVGDEAGRASVRELEERVAALAVDHGGRVVKNLGDGSLVSFGSNSAAISFALEVQDKCGDGPLKLRVGMAAGEPIQEDGDIHGTVVAHASRIGDLGDAGEVIVSDSVRQLAEGKGFAFDPKGVFSLKGFEEPEQVWKVSRR